MMKGFYRDGDTYLGSIEKLIWAHNPDMMHLHDSNVHCGSNLKNNGGRCDCRKHSFLRGQMFSGKDQFIDGWKASFCNVLNGYFTKNCEDIVVKG